ncbi:MAG TPA: peptidase domain-containing ABC transporter [Acidimicrobiales bacterium]|nr:peptidase domain-containing ABC transporter [Acidimicrobiales bacterium]
MVMTEMHEDARLAILHQLPFVLLAPEDLRPLICQMFRPIRFRFGEVIMRESEPPDGLYVLTRGSARVLTERDGAEVTLRRLEPGTAFGEAALITGGPRTATVRASEPVEALRLGRDAFDAVVALHPEIASALEGHIRLQSISDVLRLDPVFSLIPTAMLAEAISEFEPKDLGAGEVLVNKGEPGDAVYVVASGRFVVQESSGADAVPIGYMRAGDVIGERAVTSGGPRSATVTATTDARVLRFGAATFRRLLAGCPRFASAVEARDAARNRRVGHSMPLDFTADIEHARPVLTDEPPDIEASEANGQSKGRARRSGKTPLVRQFDAADCGVAALASVARFYGRPVSVTYLRDAAGTGAEGTTLRGLCSAASAIGFDATPVKVSRDRLDDVELPAIIHWEKNHWVVLYDVSGKEMILGDPSMGIRKVSREQFMESWSGYTALLRPTDALAGAPVDKASLKWVAPFLRPHVPVLSLALVLALVAAGFEVLIPVVVGRIVNSLEAHRHAHIGPSAVVLLGVVVASVVVTWSQGRILARVALRFDQDSLDFLTGKLMDLPMSYFAKRKVGDIERRLQSMSDVRRIVVQEGISALTAFALLLAILVTMLLQATVLGVVFLVVLPLYGSLMWVSNRRVRPVLATMEEALTRYSASQVDLLKGVETVKTLGVEPGLRSIMRREFGKLSVRLGGAYRALATFGAGVQLVNLGVYAAFVVLGALSVAAGNISVGTYVAFIGLALLASSPLLGLMAVWDDLQSTSVVLARLNDVLAHEPEQGRDHSNLMHVTSLEGHVSLRGVEFRYGDGDPILSSIDLEIEPGTTVAIVGRSGSGKSTLLRLIGGLLEPSAGTISIDSVDLGSLRRRELRERIGFVLQTPYIFNTTVAENIAFGREDIDMDQVRQAAEAANVHEIVARMPLGYETLVGDGAVKLSGGEAQRLSIARALYRRPPVLLLDEATSSLDAEAEQTLQQNLNRISVGRTIVVVTHRLRSVRDVDRIVVIERGRLVEQGTHDDLIKADGIYAYLYRLQYSDEAEW